MTRYFFNLRFGSGPENLAVDPEGDELSDTKVAREHALEIIGDLISGPSSFAIRDWFACSFEVENEKCELIFTIPFGDIILEDEDLTS